MRVGERRRLGHEDHIAEQRDGRPQADGGTVQGRDDRELHVEEVVEELARVAAQRLELAQVLEPREPGEVPPGTEGAAAPGEDDGAGLRLAAQLAEEPGELVVE